MASAWGKSWGAAWGNAWGAIVATSGSFSAEIDLKKRWFVRKKKALHIFNTAQEADAFIEAQEQAEKAVEQAKKTSRLARKRLMARVFKPESLPVQTVQIDAISELIGHFNISENLPNLIAQQDWEKVMEIYELAMQLQDEEDVEMLLLM